MHNENQAVALWAYDNDANASAATGTIMTQSAVRTVWGDKGVIEINVSDGPDLRFKPDGTTA